MQLIRDIVWNLASEIQEHFDEDHESTEWVKKIFDNNKVEITYHVDENLVFKGCCLYVTREDVDYTIDTWLCEISVDDHLEYETEEIAYDVAMKINEYVEPMWKERLETNLDDEVEQNPDNTDDEVTLRTDEETMDKVREIMKEE